MIEEEDEVGSPTTPGGCLGPGKTKTKKIMSVMTMVVVVVVVVAMVTIMLMIFEKRMMTLLYWLVIFFVWFIPIENDDFNQGDDFDNQVFDLIENIDFDVDDDVDTNDEGDDFDEIDDDVNDQFYHHGDDHIPARYDLT